MPKAMPSLPLAKPSSKGCDSPNSRSVQQPCSPPLLSSGAELVLLGARCDLHRQTPVADSEVIEIEHQPGQAVLHAGRQRHRVDPILRGTRRNLIAWLRSSGYREREEGEGPSCRPWCGLHGG